MRSRRSRCAPLSWAVAPGPPRSGLKSSHTAKATWRRSHDCSGLCFPKLTSRGHSSAVATWWRLRGLSVTAFQLTLATLKRLRQHWQRIQDQLIRRIDADYGVFDGRVFKAEKFAEWLARNKIAWARLESGRLDLSDDAFREAARINPLVAPLRELRSALSEMRLSDLAVGNDGRNRTLLSAFRARTGRNQPSNTRFIFGPSVWLRGLIQPPAGQGIAYVDWAQQEFGIAAALSGDMMMMNAYRSGDPYLAFAKQAGMAPADATKATHTALREQVKACVLAVQYGMGPDALALRIGQPPIRARELMRLHRETYRVFWRWSDAAVDHAMLTGHLHTVFGWHVRIAGLSNDRFLRNFPMQANGAEMLRLACCLATERGVEVCAPVHDALLICAPLPELQRRVLETQEAMREASRVVLGGFELTTEVHAVRHPERYMDPRGRVMWERVLTLLDEAERLATSLRADGAVD